MDTSSTHDPLFGTDVERAISAIPPGLNPLATAETLRDRLGGALGRRAAALRDLRIRSRGRFPEGYLSFLTRKGLEQATPHAVAVERAAQIRARIETSHIWDATCGIGADLLAFAAGGEVLGTDLDPESARFAGENLRRAGLNPAVVCADASRHPWRPGLARAVLLDPDRRRNGRRQKDPGLWSPTLSTCLEIAGSFEGACLKLPSGLDAEILPPTGSLRWVSLDGELRELSLWLGDLAIDRPQREAVALKHDGRSIELSGSSVDVQALSNEDARGIGWLAEPDPALIRAGLVGLIALQTGLAPLAPRLAYLGGTCTPAPSPWLRTWRVLGTSPLDRKLVRKLLRKHNIGPLTVKKRGHPDPAEILARRFEGPGEQPGLLAVARLERGHIALLLEPGGGGT